MPVFRYVGKDSDGKRKKGAVKAPDLLAARDLISKLNVRIEKVQPGNIFDFLNAQGIPKPRNPDLVIFTRQFATMISSGISIMECLDILADQADDPGFCYALNTIIDRVKSGIDLSDSMLEHPGVFPEIYCNMIAAGEASGQLEGILARLADYEESSEGLKREIKSAMTYPVVSLVMVLGITYFLLTNIIPKFADIFESMEGADLPGITKFVLFCSKLLTDYSYILVGGAVSIVVTYKQMSKRPKTRYYLDYAFLKMPVFGDLFQKVCISRFSRTFSTLLQSGVPILAALEITSKTSGNMLIEKAISDSIESVKIGESLSGPLAECWVFPKMVCRMIAIGEKSGALEGLLAKISDFYDDQVRTGVDSLTSLIEPLMIGVMGTIVGTIVISIFMPIMAMQKAAMNS
ncbi:MAG: pilus assembly protein PilC [Planctomycetota bacterium]|nr:MAG: pilus assembly protein PilC [Planctomycetota bacterium]